MQKKYVSVGLMSGTSGDGVDASIISSNGLDQFEGIKINILSMILRFIKRFIKLKIKFSI